MKRLLLITVFFFFVITTFSQSTKEERLREIEKNLAALSADMPGLNEKIELSVSDLDIQEFIRAIANANKINIHINPDLRMKVSNNFSNVTVASILSFLCKQYDLDISFYNNILSISKWIPIEPEKLIVYTPKEINMHYDNINDKISMDLTEDTLSKVVKEIVKKTGKNVLISPEIGNYLVSFYIENVSVESAIDKLALTNGLTTTSTDDNCIYLEKIDLPSQNNSSSNNSFHTRKRSKNKKNDFSYEVKNDKVTVTTEETSINDIVFAISEEMKKNFIIYTPLQGNITTRIEDVTYDDFLNKILNGSKYSAVLNNGIYMIGERQIENIRETKVIQLQHRSIENIYEYIPKEIQKDVTIKEFPELNSLIVSGSRHSINEIESFLYSVDKVVPVILIEVIMVSSNVYKNVSTGISLGSGTVPSQSSFSFNGGISTTLSSTVLNNIISGINSWGSFFNLGKVNSSFYLSLSALEDQGVVKVHSTPKLATLNSHEATLVIGETEYYKEVQNTVVGTESPQNIQSYEWKSIDANLSISIKPMYSGDDQITMEVKVSQSGFKQTAGNDAPPGSENKSFNSIMRVRNEEMVLLGGLEEKSTSNTGSGIPILSRIPVLRWFFSNRNKSKEDSQLNIFIRPTILF